MTERAVRVRAAAVGLALTAVLVVALVMFVAHGLAGTTGTSAAAQYAGENAWGWGGNSSGQLGDGTTTSHTTPAQVSGLTNAVAVSAGMDHSLALKSDGTAWAWGNNQVGQLGDGTTTSRSTPVQVSGLTGVVAVSAGEAHSLAVKSDGTVWAWGSNGFGELGDGTTTSRTTPVQVTGLTGAIAVSGGETHSLALKSDGTVWAWGSNGAGWLGDGTTTNRSTPVQVSGLTGAVAIGAGSIHSLALKSDGTVWAWGNNNSGQLGDGTTTRRLTPVQVSGLTGAVALGGGGGGANHSLAVKSDGTVWAWGNNFDGELGDGTTTNRSTPVQVSGLTGAVAVSAGEDHSVAVKSDGSVLAWGSNLGGFLGDGTNVSPRTTPVKVLGLEGATAVSAGLFFSIAVATGVPQPPTLVSIAVTPASPTIAAGSNQQMTATGTYSDASTANLTSSVTWASASPAVATVGAGGLAHGVAAGTSSISATSGAVSGSTLLTVTAPTLTSIAVTPAAPTIATGANQQFTATGTYSDASTANLTSSVTWASASPAVATVGAGGLAHGVAAGTSSISATSGAVSGSTLLTVTAPTLVSIAVTPAAPTIATGANQQFTATGTYSDASTAILTALVTWASASPAVATVGAGGLAHGVAAGTSSISATSGAVSGSTLLTVTAPTLTSIAVTPAAPTIATGANQQFTATGTYSDASTANLTSQVTWASGSTAVATISAGGLAHGVAAGTSSISATLGAISGSTLLTVTAATPTSFVVDSTSDLGDSSSADGLCQNTTLPVGARCTLRAAIQQANATVGAATITFAPGVTVITPGSVLPTITDTVTISACASGAPTVELVGSSAGTFDSGLALGSGSSGSLIEGLVIRNWAGNGIRILSASPNNTIRCNRIGTNAAGAAAMANGLGIQVESTSNTIGGIAAGDRNVISGNLNSGVYLSFAASGNVVRGNYLGTNAAGTAAVGNNTGITITSTPNTIGGEVSGAGNLVSGNVTGITVAANDILVQGNFIGTNAAGTAAVPNGTGVYSTRSNSTIGGTTVGSRNLISGNSVGIDLIDATGPRVRGNFIGTNAAGTAAVPNGMGIYMFGASQGTIGGTAAGAGNVISGNTNYGVWIDGFTDGGFRSVDNVIQGNSIGTDGAGTSAVPNGIGVYVGEQAGGGYVGGGSNNTIGGTVAGAGNLISGNTNDGVRIVTGTGNRIIGNSVTANGALGIDLGGDGVTANDSGDADVGGNNRQNFPVLTLATPTSISGTLNSVAGKTYRVELFANVACDASGFGEGKSFIGFVNVTTDGTGNGTFSFVPSTALTYGDVISATATDPDGNTSEFSQCKAVEPATLTSITVTPASPTIASGANQQFTATGTYSDASTANLSSSVTWASASPAVATISAAGLAHGVSQGTSTISAALGAISGNTLLTVAATNHAPVGVNDGYGVVQGNPSSFPAFSGVLANDTDQDAGTTLTAVLAAGPAHGTLTLNANGSFTYTANVAFSGTDSFTYRASDGSLTSNLVTATISVQSAAAFIDFLAQSTQITSGQQSALKDKLAKAEAFFNSGKLNAACDKLDAFIAQVNDLTSGQKLFPAVGAALINIANALKTSYGCPA